MSTENRFRVRTSIVAVMSFLTSVALVAAPALAQTGRGHFGFYVLDLDDNDFCGVATHVHAEFRIAFGEKATGKERLVAAWANDHGFHAYTNVATNMTMTATLNGVSKDDRVTDNGDGTLTIITKFSGVETLIGPDGTTLARDPGTFVEKLVVDHAGTPAFPEDDVLLSDEVIRNAPAEDSDGCAIFLQATA